MSHAVPTAIEVLSSTPEFAGLETETLRSVASRLKRVNADPSEYLLRQGELQAVLCVNDS